MECFLHYLFHLHGEWKCPHFNKGLQTMPRMARLHAPGALVHIMAHSVEGRLLFVDNEDHWEFLSRFEKLIKKCEFECHSWSLVGNHYHLVIRINEKPMSDLMRPLNGGFARWYNKKYKRKGPLFRGRFKSVLCQDSNFAKELIRYVHLNPLRANLVNSLEELENWLWCGHGYLMGNDSSPGKNFQERNKTLRRFSEDELSAQKKYLEFLSEGINGVNGVKSGNLGDAEAREIEGSKKGWPALIGDHEYVIDAMQKFEIQSYRPNRPEVYQTIMKNLTVKILEQYSITEQKLITRSRQRVTTAARQAFCNAAFHEMFLPMASIACFLKITISAVSKLVNKECLVMSTV